MARVTLKSQAIVIAQLEAQVAELTTQVGVLMSQLEASNQRIKTITNDCDDLIAENDRLVAESNRLESTVESYAHRCDALEEIVATKSAPQPQRPVTAPKPLPSPAVVDAAPTIEVSDFDRAMWAKFQALPREQRLEIIAFARPEWGHVGIHNIVEIRAAWRAAKPLSA